MVKDFWEFVYERQQMWLRREAGVPREEWTTDPTLKTQFFTNVFRELDPGTDVALEIMSEPDRPKWERLWNLVLYRRINREDTWRKYIRYIKNPRPVDLLVILDNLKEERKKRVSIFTDAHQISPLANIKGADLLERVFQCAKDFLRDVGLAELDLSDARNIQEFFTLSSSVLGPGIGSFLGWQLSMDMRYGPDPINCFSDDEWAPITHGAKTGLTLMMNWPVVGVVSGQLPTADLKAKFPGIPVFKSASKYDLEIEARRMRDSQDDEFEERLLNFADVAAPGYERLTMAAIEHSLCEWQKYVGFSRGLLGGGRGYKK